MFMDGKLRWGGVVVVLGMAVGIVVGQVGGDGVVGVATRAGATTRAGVGEGRRGMAVALLGEVHMTGADEMPEQWIRAEVAAAAGELGDGELVREVVGLCPTAWGKSEAYAEAAVGRAAWGDAAGAKGWALAAAAVAPAKAGAGGGARGAAASAPALVFDEWATGMAEVGRAQLAAEDVAGALGTAGAMDFCAEQAELYGAIGKAQEQSKRGSGAGSFVKAAGILARLPADALLLYGPCDLARDEALSGDMAGARKTLAADQDAHQRAYFAASIGEELAEEGRAEDAREVLGAAPEAVKGLRDGEDEAWPRWSILFVVADGYSALGDTAGAREAVKQGGKLLGDSPHDATPRELLDLAMAIDRVGDADGYAAALREVAAALPSDERGERAHTLWYLAHRLAMSGDPWGAAEWVKMAEASPAIDAVEVAMAAKGPAASLARCDGTAVKLGWIEKIPGSGASVAKRMAYAGAAKGMAAAGKNPKIERFKVRAGAGSASAMERLGAFYQAGFGVEVDKVEAVRWLREAVAHGSGTGMMALAMAYAEGDGVGKDEGQAFGLMKRSTEAGVVHAEALLGEYYERGVGVEKDEGKGIEWIRKGAEAQDGWACYLLGRRYETGTGVPRDAKEAMKWFRAGAEAGEAAAMRGIAGLYETGTGAGTGAEKDETAARGWYRRAAEAGDGTAAAWLRAHGE